MTKRDASKSPTKIYENNKIIIIYTTWLVFYFPRFLVTTKEAKSSWFVFFEIGTKLEMTDPFVHRILEGIVLHKFLSTGAGGVSEQVVAVFADIIERYPRQVGSLARLSADLSGRRDITVSDVLFSLAQQRIRLDGLLCYASEEREAALNIRIPSFPLRSKRPRPWKSSQSAASCYPPWLPVFPPKSTFTSLPEASDSSASTATLESAESTLSSTLPSVSDDVSPPRPPASPDNKGEVEGAEGAGEMLSRLIQRLNDAAAAQKFDELRSMSAARLGELDRQLPHSSSSSSSSFSSHPDSAQDNLSGDSDSGSESSSRSRRSVTPNLSDNPYLKPPRKVVR